MEGKVAEKSMTDIKSSLLRAISEHLDKIEQGTPEALRARDLYSRTGPGDHYSRTTPLALSQALRLEEGLE